MKLEEGKIWLRRARTLDLRIYEQNKLIESRYRCLGLQGISYDKVQVISSPENRFEMIFAEIDELKRKVDDLLLQRREVGLEIEFKISQLPESPERAILLGYYVSGEEMEKISKEIGYELSYCYKLLKRGIKAL